ncbi:MAG TPA: FlgD immunoglobulin-like domain containing protein [Candidatus Krumholzibacteria bacterium]|nr:FlgD immunoglobulin-like domain containing protein [Candidatus Krumholzibacteria bacterium]
MGVRNRRPFAPLAGIALCLLVAPAGTAHALTLQHLATSLDFSHLAGAGTGAAGLVDEMLLAVPTRTVLPPTVELTGATTEVRVGLPHEADMDIEVTDSNGQIICTASVHMPAGWQKVCFSGRDGSGGLLPNGVYFYRVRVDGEITVTRVAIER